jgi:hypothetical protein
MGAYTARISKGENPIDLPVVQLTKLDSVIDLKTPRRLASKCPRRISPRPRGDQVTAPLSLLLPSDVSFGVKGGHWARPADCPFCREKPTSEISISAPQQGNSSKITGALFSAGGKQGRQTGSFHRKGF